MYVNVGSCSKITFVYAYIIYIYSATAFDQFKLV